MTFNLIKTNGKYIIIYKEEKIILSRFPNYD